MGARVERRFSRVVGLPGWKDTIMQICLFRESEKMFGVRCGPDFCVKSDLIGTVGRCVGFGAEGY